MAASSSREREQAKQKNRLATQRFYFLIAMLALILIFSVASLVLWIAAPREKKPVKTDGGVFSVKTVTVEGNTTYQNDAVVGESGILVGQSIFSVDSNAVEEHLLKTFPYFSNVEVQTLHMKDVKITVSETSIIGTLYHDGYWVPVGANGKALGKQEITSDAPEHLPFIKGTAVPEGGLTIGGIAMDEYSQSVLQTILAALKQYNLTDITEIDLSDKSNLKMTWSDQIEVLLGNTSNLTHEIGVVASTIPAVLESRGAQITGILNVSSYSNDALENQAVFTPSSLLPTTVTAPRKPASDEEKSAEDGTENAEDSEESVEDGEESFSESEDGSEDSSEDSWEDDTDETTEEEY